MGGSSSRVVTAADRDAAWLEEVGWAGATGTGRWRGEEEAGLLLLLHPSKGMCCCCCCWW